MRQSVLWSINGNIEAQREGFERTTPTCGDASSSAMFCFDT